MRIIWTKHAEERQSEWEKTLGLTKAEVENVLSSPQQVVRGDLDDFVAQSKNRSGLLRVPFRQIDNDRKVITVYWTSKVEKYWKEEDDESKI
ncbi:MAG: DUF4258 domain-containing protein [Ignavibacterium sp.]|nr:DUF4258 domain-containing protein [Ignavibacterium sp.]